MADRDFDWTEKPGGFEDFIKKMEDSGQLEGFQGKDEETPTGETFADWVLTWGEVSYITNIARLKYRYWHPTRGTPEEESYFVYCCLLFAQVKGLANYLKGKVMDEPAWDKLVQEVQEFRNMNEGGLDGW